MLILSLKILNANYNKKINSVNHLPNLIKLDCNGDYNDIDQSGIEKCSTRIEYC